MEALGVGIVSGIVTSLILLFFQKIYLKIVRPWYDERVYKDTEIEGRWKIVYPEIDELTEEVVDLKRSAHDVCGALTVLKGADAGKTYSLSGEFKNSLLTINYCSTDRLALDRGAFVLQLTNNGYGFTGQCSYYHDSHSVISRSCAWSRVGS